MKSYIQGKRKKEKELRVMWTERKRVKSNVDLLMLKFEEDADAVYFDKNKNHDLSWYNIISTFFSPP